MSFTDNYLKLRQQREETVQKSTGGITLPVLAKQQTATAQPATPQAVLQSTLAKAKEIVREQEAQKQTVSTLPMAPTFPQITLPTVLGDPRQTALDILKNRTPMNELLTTQKAETLPSVSDLRQTALDKLKSKTTPLETLQAVRPDVVSSGLKSRINTLNEQIEQLKTADHALTLEETNERKEQLAQLKSERDQRAKQYYYAENQEKQTALQRDPAAQERYAAAQDLQADMDRINSVISALRDARADAQTKTDQEYLAQKYGLSSLAVNAPAYESRMDLGALSEKYGSLQALYDALEQQKKSAVETLAASGFDYGRMVEYEKTLQDAEKYADKQTEWTQFAQEHPVLSSVGTVLNAPFQGGDYLTTMLSGIGRSDTSKPESYVPMNVYNMDATNFVSTVRGTVSQKIEDGIDNETLGKAASFLYQTGMSVADSAAQVAAFGGAATLFMGASAASNQAKDIIERGGTNKQAFWGGLAAGAAETIFEKVSIDRLLSAKDITSVKSLLKETAKQAGTEASEEVFTEIANILSDAAIMGDKSDFAVAVAQYKAQGMSEEAAKSQAYLDCVKQVALAGAGGALSGGVMGGAVGGANYVAAKNAGVFLPGSGLETPAQAQQAAGMAQDTVKQNAAPADVEGQNNTASMGETGEYYFDAADTSNSWKDRTYTQGDKTFIQSSDRQRMYEVPKQNEIQFSVLDDGTVVLNDDVVSQLNKDDYRDFIKAYAEMNIITAIDPKTGAEINPKPIQIKSDGSRVIITQTGINDVAKKIRSAGIKSQDNVSSILLLNHIIENAERIAQAPNKHGKTTPFTEYSSRFAVGGRNYDVKLYIKNAKQGDRYYYHTLDKIDVDFTDGSNGVIDTGTYQAKPTSSDPTVPQPAQGVKSQDAQNGTGVFLPGSGLENSGAQQQAAALPMLDKSAERLVETLPMTANEAEWLTEQRPVGYERPLDANGNPIGPESSVGAAAHQFDPWSDMLDKYGAIPEGENPARIIDVPASTNGEDKVSYSARTVMEAGITPDSMLGDIADQVMSGALSHEVNTDEGAKARARSIVEDKGWDGAREVFHRAVKKGVVSKDNVALGQVLLNNAMNAGDSKTVISLLTDYASMSTTSAQSLQAQRMLKKLTPEGQLYGVQRSVSNMQEELTERYGDNAPNLEIPDELVKNFLEAQDQEGRDAAIEEIYKSIAAQTPATWRDKWNAWRYMAMLTNPRTHIRNIFGNAMFLPVRMVKNALATVMEEGIDYLSPNGIQRTKAALNPASATDRALVKAAFADVENVQDQLLGNGKYVDNATGKIEEYRTIFKFKPLEWGRKKNGNAMDVEDTWFSKPAYAGALAGYLKANGVTAQAIADGSVDGKVMDAARVYAIREAQRATYRDANAFSDFIAGLRYRGKNPVGQAANALMEGVLPFRKTPANILVRGMEYSPVGLLGKGTYDLIQVHKGNMTAAQAIDDIAAGLTGTGLTALGVLLASMGVISGGSSGDDAQDAQDDLTGGQSYALSIGGKNFTLDWLAPEALPFFVGVEAYNAWSDKSENGFQFKDALSAMERITDPMLEMSMLQGVQDMIDNVRYADGGTLPKVAANAVISYLTQAVPTLFGQIERTVENQRYSTYVDSTSGLPSDLQYTLGRVMNKLPGEYHQIPYIDAWGRTESTGNVAERAFNNFLNPSYVSAEQETEVDKELQRLYDATGDASVLPSKADKSFTLDGQTINLSADEYVEFATTKGQESFNLISALINSDSYNNMSNDEKNKAIELAYTYASQIAKKGAAPEFELTKWVGGVEDMGEATRAAFIIYKAQQSVGDISNDEMRDNLFADKSLTAAQKQQIDDSLFSDGFYIPKDVNVDYSDSESFTISQMSDSAQKRWPGIKEKFSITADQYVEAWAIYNQDGVTAAEKKAALRELVGASVGNRLYTEFGKKLD